jgi:hypothetical protein
MNHAQRRLVHFIFLYSCIEGLVVNILYPNSLAYLPKDVMIGLLYLGLMSNEAARGGSISRFTGAFAAFAAVCFLFVAMPSPVSMLGMGVALKQRLFYIPMMFAGYYYLRGDADLASLLRLMAWSAIPVSLFGVYLFFAGPAGLAAIGATYSHETFSTSGAAGIAFWRVPGTFNSPGQYGNYLSTVGTYLAGFLLVTQIRPKDRLLLLGALACILPALLTSGSRTPLLMFMVATGLVAILSKKLSRAGIVGVVIYFLIVISIGYFGGGVGDRVTSIGTEENVVRVTGTLFGQLFLPQLMADPIGEGLGVATIGARHFTAPGSVKLVESYAGLLVTEMGAAGLLAFAVLAVSIGVYLVRNRRWMKQAAGLPIWNAAFVQLLFALGLTLNSTGLDAIPGNLYFWFFVGVAVKMVDLERMRLTRTALPANGPDAMAGVMGGR